MHKLKIIPTEERGAFSLSGTIDADTDLLPLLKEPVEQLVFNLKKVIDINSIGVKKWVEGIRVLRDKGKQIEYRECPEVFIEQCNFVLEMTEDIKVSSFQVTFVCEDCDQYSNILLETDKMELDNLPPIINCPSCGEGMITEEADAFVFLES